MARRVTWRWYSAALSTLGPAGNAGGSVAGPEPNDEDPQGLVPDHLTVVGRGPIPAQVVAWPELHLVRALAGAEPAAQDQVVLVAGMRMEPDPRARARQLEGLAFLNMALNIVSRGSWQSGWKLVGAPIAAPVAA